MSNNTTTRTITNTMTFKTKEEYINLIPPITEAEFQRLKKSIKEDGLLLPVVLNQDDYVLDGHHRLKACQELQNGGIPVMVILHRKDFTNKPVEELMYVVNVNLYRRNLNVFQKAEVGIRVIEAKRKLARERQQATQFTTETAGYAADKRWQTEQEMRSSSGEADRMAEDDRKGYVTQEIADLVGVSHATVERVLYILNHASNQTVEALRRGHEESERPVGIRSVYDQLRHEKLEHNLKTEAGGNDTRQHPLIKKPRRTGELLHMFNKDFRSVGQEIPFGTADLVLAFKFPDPRRPDDEPGRIHEHLMNCAKDWLKEGGLLVMHVEEELLARVLCSASRPSGLRYYRIIVGLQRTKRDEGGMVISDIAMDNEEGDYGKREEWRPFLVFINGQKDVQPLVPRPMGRIFTNGTREEFADALVLSLSPMDGIVVDPFMNRGLTGLSVLKHGRKYIGIERESGNYLYALDMLQGG